MISQNWEEEKKSQINVTKKEFYSCPLYSFFQTEHSSLLHLPLGMQENNVLLIRQPAPVGFFLKLCQWMKKKELSYTHKSLLLLLWPETPLISLMNVPSVRVPHPSASTLDPPLTFNSHEPFFSYPLINPAAINSALNKQPRAVAALIVFVHVRARLYLYHSLRVQFIFSAAL